MPDWLTGILATLVPVAIGGIGVPLLVGIWQRLLPRQKTYMLTFRLGRAVALRGRDKLTKAGFEKAANSSVTTIYDLADGWRDGVRVDEKPLPTPPEG